MFKQIQVMSIFQLIHLHFHCEIFYSNELPKNAFTNTLFNLLCGLSHSISHSLVNLKLAKIASFTVVVAVVSNAFVLKESLLSFYLLSLSLSLSLLCCCCCRCSCFVVISPLLFVCPFSTLSFTFVSLSLIASRVIQLTYLACIQCSLFQVFYFVLPYIWLYKSVTWKERKRK